MKSETSLVFAVNGERFEIDLSSIDPSTTLIDFLRNKTPFKSVKLGCGEAFTVAGSRRSFSNTPSTLHADILSILWVVESMSHLHHDQVIFEFSSENLHNALKYPDSFPYLCDFFSQLQSLLQGQVSWCLRFAPPSENSVASTIANSVVCDLRLQSYVASQGPSWLSSLIDKEATP
uniref:RNase H type-1 domain-containing protein n=1 Tax=Brassica oleracea var. oleracea TaxID=109376 RepID=A0A0D3AKA6_BRAOL